jgi:hypothetical protein
MWKVKVKSDSSDNRGNWNHLKIMQEIHIYNETKGNCYKKASGTRKQNTITTRKSAEI